MISNLVTLTRTESPGYTIPVIPLAILKPHCRLPTDFDGDDALLTLYCVGAERRVEEEASISIREQTWVKSWTRDGVLGGELWNVGRRCDHTFYYFLLDNPPILEVTGFTYLDGDDETVELDLEGNDVQLILNAPKSYAVVRRDLFAGFSSELLNTIQIEYTTGVEADEAAEPPEDPPLPPTWTIDPNASIAICQLVAQWYRYREPVDSLNTVSREMPLLYTAAINTLKESFL